MNPSNVRNREGTSASQGGPQPNRLIGYGLADMGAAYEIRQGRSFRSAVVNTDSRTIAVDDEGIASPHLALSASHKHKVLVQDIFSEEGSFLSKGTNAEEIRVTGPVYVEHGDWLRIGSRIRFQVCLIDGPSR
jgi:hypothetical protein